MKRQSIVNKLIDVTGCFQQSHYMPPAQIRKEQFFRSTCRHLFYYGGLWTTNAAACRELRITTWPA